MEHEVQHVIGDGFIVSARNGGFAATHSPPVVNDAGNALTAVCAFFGNVSADVIANALRTSLQEGIIKGGHHG